MCKRGTTRRTCRRSPQRGRGDRRAHDRSIGMRWRSFDMLCYLWAGSRDASQHVSGLLYDAMAPLCVLRGALTTVY